LSVTSRLAGTHIKDAVQTLNGFIGARAGRQAAGRAGLTTTRLTTIDAERFRGPPFGLTVLSRAYQFFCNQIYNCESFDVVGAVISSGCHYRNTGRYTDDRNSPRKTDWQYCSSITRIISA